MGRNKYIRCETCLKKLRSDKIKEHCKICKAKNDFKYSMKICEICNKSMISWHLKRHLRIHKKNEIEDILRNIKEDQTKYEDIEKTGKIVYS